jgi:hypothetical protein
MPRARLELSCSHHTGTETGLSRKVVRYRVFFDNIELAISTTAMRQECEDRFARSSQEEAPRLIYLLVPVTVFKRADRDFAVGRRVSNKDRQFSHNLLMYHDCNDSFLTNLSALVRTEARSEANEGNKESYDKFYSLLTPRSIDSFEASAILLDGFSTVVGM